LTNTKSIAATALLLLSGAGMSCAQGDKTMNDIDTEISTAASELEDQDPMKRAFAARRLAQIGPPADKTAPALVRLLEDDAEISLPDISKSEDDMTSSVTPDLVETYIDSSPGAEAALALIAFGSPHKDQIISQLSELPEGVRTPAGCELALIAAPDLQGLFQEFLSDDVAQLRSCGAVALGRIGNSEAARVLLGSLEDNDPMVRREAAAALGSMMDPAYLEPLARLLDDDSELVKFAAASALSNLGELAIPALLPHLGGARAAAATALINIGAPAVPAVYTSRNDANPEVRENVLWVLSEIGAPEAELAARAALTDEDQGVRSGAVEALVYLQAPNLLDPLIEMLADSDPAVRAAAAYGLGTLDESAAIEPLKLLLNDDSADVRDTALEALEALGTSLPQSD
jgi:HEAT repeat protein